MFNQILLEVFCHFNDENKMIGKPDSICKSPTGKPHYNCLFSNCQFASFTSHENALCYVNEDSEAAEIISLGGEMLPENLSEAEAKRIWEQISIRKINEAYCEYMEKTKSLCRGGEK